MTRKCGVEVKLEDGTVELQWGRVTNDAEICSRVTSEEMTLISFNGAASRMTRK